MKLTKKFFSVLLVLILALSLAVSAFAEDGNSITITNVDSKEHIYNAYQIFEGDYTAIGGVKTLSNITWGDGVDGVAVLAALGGTYADAAAVAEAMTGTTPTLTLDALLAAIYNENSTPNVSNLKSTGAKSSLHTAATGDNPKSTSTISGLADGYYFVLETGTIATGSAASKYIVKVVGEDITATAKTDAPSIDKEVQDNDTNATWGDKATYSIGDTVPFKITSTVPDMSNYISYQFVVTDTMSKGLTFNAKSLAVKVGNDTLTSAAYTMTNSIDSETGITTITITFNDFIQYKGNKGAAIEITYNATLNADAVIASTGNPNKVKLTYTNNPNTSGTGDTTEHEVYVYTFEFDIEKVKETLEGDSLSGATFALFTDEASATAAALDPTADNAFGDALKFANASGIYKISSAEGATHVLADTSGKYSIEGLDAGTYYLVEIAAPAGYNRLTAPTTITISDVAYESSTSGPDTVSYKVNNTDSAVVIKVVNNSGATLPETGGMGTTIFTVVGLVLMVGAAVVLVAKRRSAAKED